MKRVIISPTKCAVSFPGYDVTTATGGQLMFDFLAGNYNAVLLAGTLAFGGTAWSISNGTKYSNNDITNYAYRVPFGKTFAAIPQAFWGVTSGYINGSGTYYPKNDYVQVQSVSQGYYITSAYAVLDVAGITFVISHSGSPEYRMDFHYVIYQR